MRRETALSLGLRLLGISLVVFPLLIALGMHNWDIMEAVFDRRGLDEIKARSENFENSFFNNLWKQLENMEFRNITSPLRITKELTFPFSITITNLSLSVYDRGTDPHTLFVILNMEEENVEFAPGETMTVSLIGSFSGFPTGENNLYLKEVKVSFEKLGVIVDDIVIKLE
jgi:hypothetical protein